MKAHPATTTKRGEVLAVLLDNALLTWGSREDLNLHFSLALIARGVRPVLVFSEAPVEELRARFQARGIAVAAIDYEKGLLRYYRELRKVVKRHSVTTIYIAFFNYFSFIPWLARLSGVRCIVYDERNPGVLQARSWRKRLLRLRTRIAQLPVTRVIAISDFLRRQLIEVGVPAKKIVLVYHGVDTDRYSPNPNARQQLMTEFAVRPDEIILAALSYLRPHKNLDVILEACAEVVSCGIQLRLFVVGDGPMRNQLQASGCRLGIADRVHWLGHIPDPVPILQACDVFLMASIGEGFGLALAEAMACGAAAVAARSGALQEIVENNVSGLLVPPGDAHALADAICRLAKDKQLRNDVATRGMTRVRLSFTTQLSISNTLNVVDSIWSG